MRIDRYLKISGIIKRRTVACDACQNGRVFLNTKIAKPSQEVKVDDVITIMFGNKEVKYRITDIKKTIKKSDGLLYEVVNE